MCVCVCIFIYIYFMYIYFIYIYILYIYYIYILYIYIYMYVYIYIYMYTTHIVGSTITPFRSRFNNYKSGARKVSKVYPKKCNVYQEQFHCPLTLRDTMRRRTVRLLSLIGLKMLQGTPPGSIPEHHHLPYLFF